MAPSLGRLRLPWGRSDEDPYWDFFMNGDAHDHRNLVAEIIRRAPESSVNPAIAELHTPEVTSSHIREFADVVGADLTGIGGLAGFDSSIHQGYPYAIVCAVRADHDPRTAPGIGGQTPVMNGRFVTFVLSAYIRELGYRATVAADAPADLLAEAAGLGQRDPGGRFVSAKYGGRVYLAEVIRTDLPLSPDNKA